MNKIFISKEEKEFYEILTEDWTHSDKCPTTRMTSAYTKQGDYIGDIKIAEMLIRRGITQFEKIKEKDCVCSIGFNPTEQKWYGWSHRAIFGFGIGSTCKKGDCHYIPATFEETKGTHYFGEPCHLLDKEGKCTSTCGVQLEINPDDPLQSLRPVQGTETPACECNKENCVYPTGKGEWIAETLEDAKQMAKDFAEGVG